MRSIILISLGVLATLCMVAGCATVNSEVQANRAFYHREYDQALSDYRTAVNDKYKQKDNGYIVHILNYGLISQYAGHPETARKCFWAARKTEEAQLSSATKTFEWLKAGDKRVYRLSKREQALLHFYLGLNYLQIHKPDKAIIEFCKIRLIEEDKPTLPLVCFYLGKAYEIAGKHDDAMIEYRTLVNLTRQKPFPPVYLEMARLYHQLKQRERSLEHLAKFRSLTDRRHRSLFRRNIIPPFKNYSELVLQVDQDELLSYCRVYADGKYVGRTQLLDVFAPTMTTGEALRKATKEATSYVARASAKTAISAFFEAIVPGLGNTLGDELGKSVLGEDSDHRSWYYAPKGFLMFVGYIPKRTRRITVEFFGPYGASKPTCQGCATHYLGSPPCTNVRDCVFVTTRYQSEPFDKMD
jgi:tetratricopeptide (TPR) repeat protein